MTNHNSDKEVIALVRPGSARAREWSVGMPTYGIYEYQAAFDTQELRFGDGSWQKLSPDQLTDLVLLEAQGSELVAALFDD